MKNVDRWLLPDGVEETLPAQAQYVEQLRRKLLDTYHNWGYELVIPPLLEFTESLFSGVGHDLELLTLKVTDQLSGRTMGLRADMTPQAARMDAHSFRKQGVNRLCYADHVVHAKPKSPLAIRTPLQVGVELFGEAGLDADIEVISLLLESLSLSDVDAQSVTLELGHVGIYRALVETAELTKAQENELFDLLQIKDSAELESWLTSNITDAENRSLFTALLSLSGGADILEQAQQVLESAPAEVSAAIDELHAITEVVQQRYPEISLYFDLSESRGYHYHTGIVFAAYVEGFGDMVANGGRYDHIGEAFGRARPATGFGLNLTSILSMASSVVEVSGIYAPAIEDTADSQAQWQAIQTLREQGERVVCGISAEEPNFVELNCDRQLVLVDGEYTVESL